MRSGLSPANSSPESERRYLADTNGEREAVVLALELCRRLLEDLHDLTVVAERGACRNSHSLFYL